MDEQTLTQMLWDMGSEKVERSNSVNLQASCPFAAKRHANAKDSNPSFSVEISPSGMSRWNCFACGCGGNSIHTLVWKLKQEGMGDFSKWSDYEKKSERGDNSWRLGLAGLNIQRPSRQWSSQRQQHFQDKEEKPFDWKEFEWAVINTHPSEIASLLYAKERGITEETAKRWRLGIWSKMNRLFIPFFDHEGRFVGYSNRTLTDEKPKFKHASGFVKEYYLYGEEHIDLNSKTAVLVEGFADVWKLDSFGVINPLAFCGGGVGVKQVGKLHRWTNTVIIIPDNDKPNEKTGEQAGHRMAENWRRVLQEIGKKVIISPVLKGRKDVAEWSSNEFKHVLQHIQTQYNVTIPCRS